MNNQRTILVPAGLDKRVQIQGDRASADYIRIFARNVSTLAFSFQFSTARAQFGELLTFFTPEAYASAEKTFADMAATIEASKVNSSFTITKHIEVNPEKGTINISGVQRQWVDNLGFIDPKNTNVLKSYLLTYVVRDGKFMLAGISEGVAKSDVKDDKNSKEIKVKPETAIGGGSDK
jgi:type IV conjugative transfer system protein TraE